MCANTYHCPKKALSVSSLCKKGPVLGSAGFICLLHLNILFPTNTNSWWYLHFRPVSLLSDCSQEPIESKCESASNGLVQWFLTLIRHQSPGGLLKADFRASGRSAGGSWEFTFLTSSQHRCFCSGDPTEILFSALPGAVTSPPKIRIQFLSIY